MKSPAWSRDELILALDLYLRTRPKLPGKASAAVAQLSAQLNSLALVPAGDRRPDFRNPAGAYLKLTNFLAIDPAYKGKGMSHGNRLEPVVWAEFSSDPARCHQVALAILADVKSGSESKAPTDPELLGVAEAPEGRTLTRRHVFRERDPRLVKRKKAEVLAKKGELRCEVCGFVFAERYGERGADFIECHHTKPLVEYKAGDTTRLADLALLCANCHRMIHAKQPWLTVEELRVVCVRR